MDIEEVARTHPEQIMTFAVDPATGIMPITAGCWRRRWDCTATSPRTRKV
jgi:succinyl-CoA synthetase beta subunit